MKTATIGYAKPKKAMKSTNLALPIVHDALLLAGMAKKALIVPFRKQIGGRTMPNNRQQLIELKQAHKLRYADLMRLTGKSWYTVKSWLLRPDSKASRSISDEDLDKIRLANKAKSK